MPSIKSRGIFIFVRCNKYFITVFENIVAYAMDVLGWSRKKSVLVNLVANNAVKKKAKKTTRKVGRPAKKSK